MTWSNLFYCVRTMRLYVIHFILCTFLSIRLNDVGYCCALNSFLNGIAYYLTFFSSFSIFFSLIFSHSHFLLLSFSPHQRVNWMFVSQWKKNQFNIQFILIHVWFVFVTHFLNIYAHFMMLCATPFRAHCSFSMMQWLIARSLTRINSLHVLFRPFYHFISIIITSCA